jgi:hypothetical protein
VQTGTAQYHINADIAYAIRRYVNVRGDAGILREIGAEILVETARLWEDLGFYDSDGKFHIHGVTGPDEYTTVVNDNPYTNLMARLNLNFAAAAVRRLRDERPGDYTALATRSSSRRTRPSPGNALRRRCTCPSMKTAASTRRMTPSSAAKSGTSMPHRQRNSRCCCTITRW